MARHSKSNASASNSRDATHFMGVVDEVELAFSPRSRLATQLGFILGGVIPIATYLEAHWDLDATQPLYTQPAAFLVAGGLLFSAKTVFTWGQRAFRDGWKAAGFVVLLEGVMITSHVPVLPLVLLAILVAINGIATGCTLSLDRKRAPQPAPARTLVAVPLRAAPPASASSGTDVTVVTQIIPVPRARRAPRSEPSPQKRFAFGADAS